MSLSLEGKIAIVTGCGRGIGRGIAVTLAHKGADLVLNDVVGEHVQKVAAEIENGGRRAVYVIADVSKRDEAQRIVDTAVEHFGGLHILVNNAGINRDNMLHRMTEEEWNQVIAVNLTGTFNCMQAAVAYMRGKEYGRIINISSAGWLGNIGQANYSASKAGVVGLSKTAAKELARKGITVNAICPGFIDTEMTRGVPSKVWDIMVSKIPMGRVGTPQDVANVVAFLASEEASYVTGEVINVGGGFVL